MSGMTCEKCKAVMEPAPVDFEYMGHGFSHEFLRCPVCRQVYIPEDIVSGRMADVERELEDK